MLDEHELDLAAEAIGGADALLIGAGAGMGVDSGLPDFRGNEGFWNAYPPFRGRSFAQVANPVWFQADPEQAWGFYGHRLTLYRDTVPHRGFDLLRHWMKRAPYGGFVFTSNVDGQFQRAGFEEDCVVECHGSLHWLQCAAPCSDRIWPADGLTLEIDSESIRARSALPRCTKCGGVARPNVLMFGDACWLTRRCEEQWARYGQWRREVADAYVVAIEVGAGTSIPTVRFECEQASTTLVRINPREWWTNPGGISLAGGALEVLSEIEARL